MSDSSGHRTDDTAPAAKPWKKDTRNVPPLVWVILVALVAVVIVGFLYAQGPKPAASPAGPTAPAGDADVLPPDPATAAPAAPAEAPAAAPAAGN
jgi:hypothetical protein